MSQDKPVLTVEQIEKIRQDAVRSAWAGTKTRAYTAYHTTSGIPCCNRIIALCDLALSALDRQGWISVEDRLPEPNTRTLVFAPKVWFDINRWYTSPVDGKTSCERGGVTHWMLLPPTPQINEPPQENTEERSGRAPSGTASGPASGSPDEET